MALRAVKDGNLDKIILMGDVSDVVNGKNENVMHVAARFGQLVIFDYLSNEYFHLLESTDYKDKTVLHHAVENRCLPIVQKIVSLCDDLIHSRDINDDTPLQRAIQLKFSEASVVMIQAKPGSLGQKTMYCSQTLLHCAVEYCDDVLIRYLCLVCSSLLKRQNDLGRTPLGTAFITRSSLTIVKLLYEANPTQIDICDKDSIMPIFHVRDVEIMTYLLEVCPHVIYHKLPQTNENLLHNSSRFQDAALTRKLLEFRPALLQEVSNVGEFPLQVAFCRFATSHVNTILKFKPDFVCVDKKGNTVLHMAVQCCEFSVIRNVFENCRDNLHCENTNGKTPFCLAARNGNRDAVTMFKPHITFDMAFAMRIACNKYCNIDYQPYMIQQCATLNNLLLQDIADIVFEYLSVAQNKTPKQSDISNHPICFTHKNHTRKKNKPPRRKTQKQLHMEISLHFF